MYVIGRTSYTIRNIYVYITVLFAVFLLHFVFCVFVFVFTFFLRWFFLQGSQVFEAIRWCYVSFECVVHICGTSQRWSESKSERKMYKHGTNQNKKTKIDDKRRNEQNKTLQQATNKQINKLICILYVRHIFWLIWTIKIELAKY